MPCWWAPTRAKQLSMAATARVIWLCACVRYWPYRGVGRCASLLPIGIIVGTISLYLNKNEQKDSLLFLWKSWWKFQTCLVTFGYRWALRLYENVPTNTQLFSHSSLSLELVWFLLFVSENILRNLCLILSFWKVGGGFDCNREVRSQLCLFKF